MPSARASSFFGGGGGGVTRGSGRWRLVAHVAGLRTARAADERASGLSPASHWVALPHSYVRARTRRVTSVTTTRTQTAAVALVDQRGDMAHELVRGGGHRLAMRQIGIERQREGLADVQADGRAQARQLLAAAKENSRCRSRRRAGSGARPSGEHRDARLGLLHDPGGAARALGKMHSTLPAVQHRASRLDTPRCRCPRLDRRRAELLEDPAQGPTNSDCLARMCICLPSMGVSQPATRGGSAFEM